MEKISLFIVASFWYELLINIVNQRKRSILLSHCWYKLTEMAGEAEKKPIQETCNSATAWWSSGVGRWQTNDIWNPDGDGRDDPDGQKRSRLEPLRRKLTRLPRKGNSQLVSGQGQEPEASLKKNSNCSALGRHPPLQAIGFQDNDQALALSYFHETYSSTVSMTGVQKAFELHARRGRSKNDSKEHRITTWGTPPLRFPNQLI